MKVTLFTSNNYRHNYLINLLSNFCDELWVVQECKTLFTGKNDEKLRMRFVLVQNDGCDEYQSCMHYIWLANEKLTFPAVLFPYTVSILIKAMHNPYYASNGAECIILSAP